MWRKKASKDCGVGFVQVAFSVSCTRLFFLLSRLQLEQIKDSVSQPKKAIARNEYPDIVAGRHMP